MSADRTEDPAFPSEPRTRPEGFEPGMTLREWYVGQTLDGAATAFKDADGNIRLATQGELDVLIGNALAIAEDAVQAVRS